MKESFGQRLSRLRKEKGMTQEEVASKITISPQAVSKWENDISSPDISTLGQLADMLGVSVDELLGREEELKGERVEAEKVDTEVVNDNEKYGRKEGVRFDDEGIHVVGDDGTRVEINNEGIHVNGKTIKEARKEHHHQYTYRKALTDVLASVSFFLGLIAFIIAGFLWKDHNLGWASGWTFILFGIALGSLIKAIAKRRVCIFAYPVFIAGLYCFIGFLGSAYNFPGFGFYWFLFITIPIYYIIGHYIDQLTEHEKIKVEDDEDDD